MPRRRRRLRRDPPSFAIVRELAQRTRRGELDSDEQRVLHDALIERYGDLYLQFVHEAALISQTEPAYVVMHLGRLRSREAWVKRKPRSGYKPPPPIPFEVTPWPMTSDVITFVSAPRKTARDHRRRQQRASYR